MTIVGRAFWFTIRMEGYGSFLLVAIGIGESGAVGEKVAVAGERGPGLVIDTGGECVAVVAQSAPSSSWLSRRNPSCRRTSPCPVPIV